MNKSLKNIVGLILIGFIYSTIAMPLILGETIRFSLNGAMLLNVIGLPLISFVIPGIIALNIYANKKVFWGHFYNTGWIIYILILIGYSFVLSGLKFM